MILIPSWSNLSRVTMNGVHSAAYSHGGTKVQKIGLLWKDAVSTIIQDDLTPLEFLSSFEELRVTL